MAPKPPAEHASSRAACTHWSVSRPFVVAQQPTRTPAGTTTAPRTRRRPLPKQRMCVYIAPSIMATEGFELCVAATVYLNSGTVAMLSSKHG
jgi:hypothetical protein